MGQYHYHDKGTDRLLRDLGIVPEAVKDLGPTAEERAEMDADLAAFARECEVRVENVRAADPMPRRVPLLRITDGGAA